MHCVTEFYLWGELLLEANSHKTLRVKIIYDNPNIMMLSISPYPNKSKGECLLPEMLDTVQLKSTTVSDRLPRTAY